MILKSPKVRFQKSDRARHHAELMAAPDFQTVLDIALQQLLWDFGTAPEGNTAAARHYMIEGAKRYIDTLTSLADPEQKPKPLPGDNLPYPNA